jgi:hypothetical protein
MSLSFLGWLFALGVVIHNVEEALFFQRGLRALAAGTLR